MGAYQVVLIHVGSEAARAWLRVRQPLARTHGCGVDLTMAYSESRLPLPAPSVVYKALGDGGVLLSTTDEVYFGVNRVGARIWSLLPPVCTTFDELCDTLSREFTDVDLERIRRDAGAFLSEVVTAGLASPPSSAVPVGPGRSDSADSPPR